MAERTSAYPLIRTKLQQPRLPGDLILRRRLLDRLHAGSNRKLTLISAQAGAGKTTLLAQWLDECPRPSAWVSLDQHDNDLTVFVSYLIGAVRTVFPSACEGTLDLLGAPQSPPLRVLTTSLVNELHDLCTAAVLPDGRSTNGGPSSSGLILALDDYQAITESSIHELLSALLKHLPQGCHLALASRSDPPFSIHQLRARREMTEVRYIDLRFTPRETEAFLQGLAGGKLSAEMVALLVEKTEGWIVGLRLAALSVRDLPDGEAFVQRFRGTSSALIVEYLLREALARQSAEVQDFVLRTSVLDRFCAPLCEALTEVPATRSQEIIEWIAGANLFLVLLDEEGRWYRYHHLFRDLLRSRLRHQKDSDEIATLHTRASEWFAQNLFLEEGFEYALAAGDADRAARLVEEHRHELMNREQWRRLGRWLELLPPQLVKGRLHLLLVRAWLIGLSHRFGELVPILERAGAMLERDALDLSEEERIALDGEIATLWSGILYYNGQGQRSVEYAQHAIDVTPPEHAWVVGNARCHQICAYQLLDQLDLAYQELHRAQAEFSHYNDAFAAQIHISHLTVALLNGNLRGAEEASNQLARLAEPQKMSNGYGWALLVLGHVHYQCNDLKGAEQYYSRLLAWRYRTSPAALAHGSFGLALTYRAMGKHAEAAKLAEAATEWARENSDPTMLLEACSFASRLDLLSGRAPDAEYWAASLTDAFSVMLLIEIPHLTLATVLIAQGTPGALQEADELLGRIRQFVEGTHNVWRQIEVLALQALLRDAQSKRENALSLLERAVLLAEPGGFIRLFVDLGPPMARLLDHLRWQGVAVDYIIQILIAFETTDERRTTDAAPSSLALGPSSSLPECLTPRELEVLALLARHLSNPEISERLVISPGTVKTHTLRIYRKLDVRGRQQAVAKARELGIL